MKKSNLILLCLILVVLVTCTATAITIRVKVDHHWYVTMEAPKGEVSDLIPVGVFSVIVADGLNGLTVLQNPGNGVQLPLRTSEKPVCRLEGDTLKVSSAGQDGSGVIMISVANLKALYVKNTSTIALLGLKADSLFIKSEGSGGTTLIRSELGSLRLQLDSSQQFTFDHTDCRVLWPYMDSSASLAMDSSRVGRIVGKWNGTASLKMDGVTLNGIQKIEHVQ